MIGAIVSRKYLLVFSLYMLSVSVYGQDLLHRIKDDTPPQYEIIPNRLSKNLRQLKSRSAAIPLFELKTPLSIGESGVPQVVLSPKDVTRTLKSLKGGQQTFSIPVDEKRSIQVSVYEVKINHSTLKLIDEKENVLSNKDNEVKFYRGIVSDDPSSIVALTISSSGIHAVISDQKGNYNLGQLQNSKDYVLYNDFTLETEGMQCLADDQAPLSTKEIEEDIRGEKSSGNCVKVFVEADYETYMNLGQNQATVTNFIQGTFNAVATIYDNEGVSIELSGIKIWTTQDTYGADSNVSGALTKVRQQVGTNFDGDLFHLVSAVGNCCSWSGIATVYCNNSTCSITKTTALCKSSPHAVSQTTLFYNDLPSYSWTVNVFAHEMGHNMGSPHTQACQWGPNQDTAIDGCVNVEGSCSRPSNTSQNASSIMSYCHTVHGEISLSYGFGPEVGDLIRNQYASVTCLTGCTGGGPPPTCSDGVQNGNETGVDCGGSDCPACTNCNDGIQNGNETGVDCGGPDCSPCATCNDGIQNGSETNVDCGGPDCNPCSQCFNGVQDGDETGIDCGGSSCEICPCDITNNLIFNNVNIPSNSLHVDEWVKTSGNAKVLSGTDVSLYATDYIELGSGIEIHLNSNVFLSIEDCKK